VRPRSGCGRCGSEFSSVDVSTEAKLVAVAANEHKAALLGDSPRRGVVNMAAEVGASQSKLAGAPDEQSPERLRRKTLASQLRCHHVGDVRFVASRSKLNRADCFAILSGAG